MSQPSQRSRLLVYKLVFLSVLQCFSGSNRKKIENYWVTNIIKSKKEIIIDKYIALDHCSSLHTRCYYSTKSVYVKKLRRSMDFVDIPFMVSIMGFMFIRFSSNKHWPSDVLCESCAVYVISKFVQIIIKNSKNFLERS